MEPMKPMKPMAPMKPMEPMKPLPGGEAWWPDDLGSPSASGGQNGLRYAFFPDRHRLLIEENGATTAYDSGDHAISGVSQDGSGAPAFSSQHGTVKLDALTKVG